MGIISTVENFNKLYEEYCKDAPPIIVNHYPLNSIEERRIFNEKLITQYEGETISTVPHCECRKYVGGKFKGRVCENCGHRVISDIERPIRFSAWLRAPKGVDTLINPLLFYQIYQKFNYSTFNVFEWVINPTYTVTGRKDPLIKAIEVSGVKRGLNNFFHHYEEVLDILFQRTYLKSGMSNAKIKTLKNYFLYHIRSGAFFTQHLPLQSKAMFITEKTNYGTYASELMLEGQEPAVMISNLDNSAIPITQKAREARTVKALIKLAQYHLADLDKTWCCSNTGAIRNHIYSSRTDWTGRAVIGSIQDPMAELDEVHLPWAIGLTLFEVHVTNKLLKRGFSADWCSRIIESSISDGLSIFKPLLEKILQEILDECNLTDKYGHPCTMLRNPSLTRGSSQCLRITKIKHDVNDKVIAFHLLVYKAPNADLDGDQMTVSLVLDKFMYDMIKALEPHNYALDLNRCFSVGPYTANTNEAKITIRHWLESNY